MRRGDGCAREGDHGDRGRFARESRSEITCKDEFRHFHGRVVRRGGAGATGLRADHGRGDRAKNGFEVFRADRARAQDHRPCAREVEHRRFEADFTRAAVENREIRDVSELLGNVCGGRWRDAAGAVRARRSDRVPEGGDQRLRDGVRGTSHSNRRAAANRKRRDRAAPVEDHRKRARPECLREFVGALIPTDDCFLRHRDARNVRDQRIGRRPPLHAVDLGNRSLAARIARKTVDRLRRKRDGQPPTEALGALRDVLWSRFEDHGHACNLAARAWGPLFRRRVGVEFKRAGTRPKAERSEA